MNPLTIFLYVRSIIASMLGNIGFSQALAISLANFSLAAIGIVLLLIYPQVVILVLLVAFVLFGLKH